ncbi:hypothetical protein [Catenulispora yoronensis]|uniref:hypothetical protein n=1 Tax=Catenulispora yoronensis TaxID=450799 RepID=UPI0031D4F90D
MSWGGRRNKTTQGGNTQARNQRERIEDLAAEFEQARDFRERIFGIAPVLAGLFVFLFIIARAITASHGNIDTSLALIGNIDPIKTVGGILA